MIHLNLGYVDCDGQEEHDFMGEIVLRKILLLLAGCAYLNNESYQMNVLGLKYSNNYSIDDKDKRKALKIAKKNYNYHDLPFEIDTFLGWNNYHTYHLEKIDRIKPILSKYEFEIKEDIKKREKKFVTQDDFCCIGHYEDHCLYGTLTITPTYLEKVYSIPFLQFTRISKMDVIDSMARKLSTVTERFNPKIHAAAKIDFSGSGSQCGCSIFCYSGLSSSVFAEYHSYGMENAESTDIISAITSSTLNRFLFYINYNKPYRWIITGFEIVLNSISVILKCCQTDDNTYKSWAQ